MNDSDHTAPWKRLTLISGMGRAGTTWLGDLLAAHPQLEYIFEPYSRRYHPELTTSETAFRLIGSHYDPDKSPVPFWCYRGAALEVLSGYQHILRDHLAALVRHYFSSTRVEHLVIKQPAAEKLQWMVDVLRPDNVIVLSRHPGGVLNSYLNWNMLAMWSDPEFELAQRTACETHPGLEDLFALADNSIERFMVLFILKERFLAADDLGCPISRVRFEDLCRDPAGALQQTLAFLGIAADDEVIDRCISSIRGARPRAPHIDVNVNSAKRAVDWQRTLSPRILRTMNGIACRLDYPCPLPGHGMPSQGLWVRMTGTIRDAARCAGSAYRRLRARIPVRRLVARLVPGLGRPS